ncbi:MAG: PAS domain-containing protein, partial [Chloroflexi bacterium]|nr:PAS domain-containing protein [Chloroflexota bacterium]
MISISAVAIWKFAEFIGLQDKLSPSAIFELLFFSIIAPMFVWFITMAALKLAGCAREGSRRYVEHYKVAQEEIEEKRKVVPALTDTAKLYEILYMEAPHSYFCATPQGELQTANKSAEQLLGRPINEFIGTHVFDLYADTPDGKPKIKKLRAKIQEGILVSNEELQMQRADGSTVWVELSVHPVFGANGELISSLGMAIDISERKKAEAEQQRLISELRGALA